MREAFLNGVSEHSVLLRLVLILCYLNRVTRVYLSMLHAWSTKAASLPKLVDPVFIPVSREVVLPRCRAGGAADTVN